MFPARRALLPLLAGLFLISTVSGQSLPLGWSHRDIGSVGVAGSASYSNGIFTVSGAGPQVWATADGMHFVYQPLAGDGSLIARVVSVSGVRSGTNPVVGAMIRETLGANSSHVSSVYRNNPLVELLWRPAVGFSTQFTNSSGSSPLPYWVKVARSGSTFSAYMSPNGTTWTQVGATQTITVESMRQNVYVGLVVSSNDSNNNSLVTATFDNVSVSGAGWAAPSAPWLDQDVGAVGVAGNASYTNGVFTVSGAGPQIWGTADGMHFVYQPLSGNGTIVARVVSVQGVQSGYNPVVGAMIRESLNANATEANSTWRNNPLVNLMWRASTGGSSSSTNSSNSTPLPYWVKMARSGNSFSASMSPDGVTWTQVGASQTINMATNTFIGLAVSSENSNNNSLVTATFDNLSVSSTASPAPTITSIWPARGLAGYDVSISGTGFGNLQGNSVVLLNGAPMTVNSWSATSIAASVPASATSGPLVVSVAPSMNNSNPATFKVLPAGWLDQDVGAVGVVGNASYGNGAFTISAAGPQVGGTADGMHFVYQSITGDTTVLARVANVQGMRSGTGARAGVMIRESLNANLAHAYSLYCTNIGGTSGGPKAEFLWRATTGGGTSFVDSGIISAPYWVKMVRAGNTFSAYISATGSTWTQLGSTQTISMAANAYVGLAVSSDDSSNNSLVTATIDNVSVTAVSTQPPVITDLNPFSGPVGTSVIISGANFGPQGASTVSFNGVAAGPGVWSPTAITVPVPYGATTGNIVVKANGLNSNGVTFTVASAPTITGLSPTSGPVGTPVTITGTNFGPSQASSTVAFSGVTAPTVTSWSPTSIVVNVPNGAITGAVQVTVSGASSNIAIFTVPSTTPTIIALSPASGPVGTSVTIIGSNFGTTPGSVSFNGKSAAIGTWTSASIVAAVPASATTGPVIVTANGVASNPATFTVYSIQPGTPTLIVNPSTMNMHVGQTQPIQLLDKNGVPFNNPTWSIGNPSIAAIVPPANQGDPTLIQANATGNTTLTGTSSDGRTGSAQVSILAGTAIPIGTVQWEVPSFNTGFGGIVQVVQSLRIDDTTPDFYLLDSSGNGDNTIRAFTADGQQKWTFTPSAEPDTLGILAADDQGGLIYKMDDSFSDVPFLGRVDQTGTPTWLRAGSWGGRIAIHPDGTIYFVQSWPAPAGISPSSVVALDGTTGQTKFTIPLPTSTWTTANESLLYDPNGGTSGNGYPIWGYYCTPGTSIGPLPEPYRVGYSSISSDGTVYIPISTSVQSFDVMPCDSTPDLHHPGYPHLVQSTNLVTASSVLQVLVIHADGSYSFRQLDSTSSALFESSSVFARATPDGNGGMLLAVDNSSASVPSTFYHDDGSAVAKLTLTINPKSEILTGEDGTAYVSGTTSGGSGAILAINTASNTINWTASPPGGLYLNDGLLAVPATGGVVFQDASGHLNITDPNGVITPLFPGSGGTDAGPVNTGNANYWTLGTWFASLSDGGFGAIAGNNIFLSASQRPVKGGSEKQDSKPRAPRIVNYLPSQIESQPPGQSNIFTANYPCYMDDNVWNPRRDYSTCTTWAKPSDNIHDAAQTYRTRASATVRQFWADVADTSTKKGWEALAYIGHSVVVNPDVPWNEFSIGITFYYPISPGTTPGDASTWDVTYSGAPATLSPECLAPNNYCDPNKPGATPVNKLLNFEKNAQTVTGIRNGLGQPWSYANSAVTTALTPGPPHPPLLLVDKIAQQPRILFFGACALSPQLAQPNEMPVFVQMWDINDVSYGTPETRPRAMVVPDGNSVPGGFDTNSTDLVYAAVMWTRIVKDLVVGIGSKPPQKVSIQDAVDDANATITPTWNSPQQPKFKVLGNHNVGLVR